MYLPPPAFGYAGVGFPTLGMNAFAQFWGALLPLRWYMAVLLGQAARGLPLSDSARPFVALAALAVLYTLLAFLRLHALTRTTSRPSPAPEPAAAVVRPPASGEPLPVSGGTSGAFILLVLAARWVAAVTVSWTSAGSKWCASSG